ncbi:carbohydrate ABC transporter permease [Microbacterium terricola]|uniref:Sugar ABC transporter permease n=1 Tax=Microbacterium terricola TaxID=344163 RepID=A0ABM8DWR8_9MICO|nr:carbohydrate ABC transporter permease [Microbacterium terricola]UYK39341.1 carbohydrate ABC transporter permease [Microbacterium terricola]BDV29936.1 sugar ABC transporter permease [Microbacterium terricola]
MSASTATAASAELVGLDPVTPVRRRRFRPAAWGWSVLALVLAAAWAFPVYWMVTSSMLSTTTLESFTPTFHPFGGSFANYTAVMGPQFWSALGISVSVTLIAVFCCLLFAFLAAVAISRFRFRGRTTFVIAILVVQMLPAEGLFVAQYKMMSELGLLSNILGLSLLYIAAVVPFTVWMLRGFVQGVPAELEEAAMIDGLSRTQAFMRVTLPLLAPGLVASGVFAFLQCWNEFTVALVIMSADNETLPLWLRGFVQASATRAIDWGQVMAASTIVAIPVIIFFVIVQGRMTSGLVSGAVKG